MITYARYHAANPLPAFRAPLRIEYAVEPPVGIGRVIKYKEAHAPKAKVKPATDDEILAELSATEWRGAAFLAIALQVNPGSLRKRLCGRRLEARTQRRMVHNRFEWMLK